jgi:hypothetical protein
VTTNTRNELLALLDWWPAMVLLAVAVWAAWWR